MLMHLIQKEFLNFTFFILNLKKLPSLVTAYEKRAERLNEALKESRQDFESREDLSDETREALREEFAQYEA